MSHRARARRKRLRAALRALTAELARLPSYNPARVHSWYAADALRTLAHWAPKSGVVLRGQCFPMPR